MKTKKKNKNRIPAFAEMTLGLRKRAEESSAHLEFLLAEAEKAVTSMLHGEHRQRKSGTGERFWQFREYSIGDRPQDIDWRQSGKTDRVFIRQREWQTNQSAWLWCSRSKGMDFSSSDQWPQKSEAAQIITLALALLMTHAGEEVGLLGSHRKGKSEGALQFIGENLLYKTLLSETLPAADIPRNSALYLCGDFLEPLENIRESFQTLASQSDSGVVVQVLDPAELALPYDGRIMFEKPDDKKRELVNNVESIRTEYARRINAHIDGVKKICQSCEWHYVLHVTDRDIRETMLDIWTTLSLHNSRAGILHK